MQYLLRRKIILLVVLVSITGSRAFSQLRNEINLPEHDDKAFHFGINLGYNKSHFLVSHHPRFLQYDTINVVESINSAGINLAWLVNYRLGEHWDLRLHPLDLTFSEKAFLYNEKYGDDGPLCNKKSTVYHTNFSRGYKIQQ